MQIGMFEMSFAGIGSRTHHANPEVIYQETQEYFRSLSATQGPCGQFVANNSTSFESWHVSQDDLASALWRALGWIGNVSHQSTIRFVRRVTRLEAPKHEEGEEESEAEQQPRRETPSRSIARAQTKMQLVITAPIGPGVGIPSLIVRTSRVLHPGALDIAV
jgi:hypothetical protein